MIHKIVLCVMLLGFSSITFAQAVEVAPPNPCTDLAEATRNKTQGEVNTILEACRENKGFGLASNLPKITPAHASEWSSAAKSFAEAIGIAARELGIATNEFLMSPAGLMLVFLLLMNYAGGALIGVPMSLFTILFWWVTVKRIMREDVKYIRVPVLWGAFTVRRVEEERYEKNETWGIYAVVSGFATLLLNLIIWINVT